MADIYFPNVMSALPEPRFVEPQSNTGAMAMGSALQALTSVAGNFRQKEMNVQKANQMADALEKEGLTQEANLYRQAAQSYQMDFFATPQENERFNQSLLNDTLRLLANKQEREMKAEQLKLETQYKRSLIENQEAEALRAEGRLALDERLADIRKQEIEQQSLDRQDALNAREQGKKVTALNATLTNLRQQRDQAQEEADDIYKRASDLNWSDEEYAKTVAPAVDRVNNIQLEIDRITNESYSAQGIQFNTPKSTPKNIQPLVTKQEAINAKIAQARQRFIDDPLAKEVTVEGTTYDRDTVMRETTKRVNEKGEVSTSETIISKKPEGLSAEGGKDPNAPYVPKSRY